LHQPPLYSSDWCVNITAAISFRMRHPTSGLNLIPFSRITGTCQPHKARCATLPSKSTVSEVVSHSHSLYPTGLGGEPWGMGHGAAGRRARAPGLDRRAGRQHIAPEYVPFSLPSALVTSPFVRIRPKREIERIIYREGQMRGTLTQSPLRMSSHSIPCMCTPSTLYATVRSAQRSFAEKLNFPMPSLPNA
jgi:hypothetical protein